MALNPKPLTQTDSQRKAAHWKKQIELTKENNHYKQFVNRGEQIVRRYRDERGDRNTSTQENVVRRMAMLWANTQTTTPALLGRPPVPIAERRFKDKDVIARIAASILERSMRNSIETNGYYRACRRAVLDYQLPGRGQVWVRYEPKFEQSVSLPSQVNEDELGEQDTKPEQETPEEEKLESTGEELVMESVPVDYVNWKDYFQFPAIARTWEEVQAIGKRVYMDKEALIERFGEEKAKLIPLTHSPDEDDKHQTAKQTSEYDMAEVFEIWCKYDKTVYWIAEGYDELCDEKPDPLNLTGFFPCPEPLCATMTNDTQFPVPEYIEYQDQALEIDQLTQRIHMLTKACKVAGAYDAASQPLARLLDESVENRLIPVDSWAAFAEKGGLQGVIAFLPLKDIMETINQLVQVRKLAIEDMDRITGITDIMRGTTDSRETMGAQRLKTNSSNTRLSEKQNEVARFCRDVLCIMGEIIAEQFQPETLIEISGAMYEEGVGPDTIEPAQPLNPMMGHNGGPPLSPIGGSLTPPMALPQSPMAPGLPPQAGMLSAGPFLPPDPKQLQMQRIMQAIQLLKNEKLRGFRIDIETDSTVAGNSEQDKVDRVEFIKGVTEFLKVSGEIGLQMPDAIPMLGKMLQFGARGFRVGRDLEHSIEEFCDQAEKSAKQRAANPPPNPEQIKAEAQQKQAEMDMAQAQLEGQNELKRQALENQGEQANAQIDLQSKQIDLMMKKLDAVIEAMKAGNEHRQTVLDGVLGEREHERAMELGETKHKQAMAAAKKPANGQARQ